MKTFVVFVGAFALAMLLSLSACAQNEKTPDSKPDAEMEARTRAAEARLAHRIAERAAAATQASADPTDDRSSDVDATTRGRRRYLPPVPTDAASPNTSGASEGFRAAVRKPGDLAKYPVPIQTLLAEGERQRPDRIKWLRAEIVRAGQSLQHLRARSDISQVEKASSVPQMQSYIRDLKAELAALSAPYTYLPEIDLSNATGIGRIYVPLQVFQVVDDHDVIVKSDDQLMWLSNIATKTAVNGGGIGVNTVMTIKGTRQYTTVAGTTNTILEVAPVELPPELTPIMAINDRHPLSPPVPDPGVPQSEPPRPEYHPQIPTRRGRN